MYGYDPLGRRLFKRSSPIVVEQSGAGSKWLEAEQRRLTQERGLGTTYYGWDGDQMVIETDYGKGPATHYVFEPNNFVPLLQASSKTHDPRAAYLKRPARATETYVDADGNYDLDRDPLYNGSYEPGLNSNGDGPPPLEHIHYYQCDRLGTPMELTDGQGNIAWEASYKAWGEAKITISEVASKAGLRNPIRFQGQHFESQQAVSRLFDLAAAGAKALPSSVAQLQSARITPTAARTRQSAGYLPRSPTYGCRRTGRGVGGPERLSSARTTMVR